MSPLLEIVYEAIELRRMTPTLESKLDEVLWSTDFNYIELAALECLEKLLAEGSIVIE